MQAVLLLILFSSFARSDDGIATALVEKVAKTASDTTSWRVEGSVLYDGAHPETVPFLLVAHSPKQLHFEQLRGPTPAMIVCDGTRTMTFSPALGLYSRSVQPDSPDCSLILDGWRKLGTTLEWPEISGKCGADPASFLAGENALIRGTSKPDLPMTGRINRTLCIDQSRSVIVWEKAEFKSAVRVYLYTKVQRDADILEGAFQSDPPVGAESIDVELPLPRPLGIRGPLGPGATAPRLLSKKEPNYDERSRKAGVEGTVVLWAIIGVDGVPSCVKVFRSLTAGLDAEAVKALKRWRFEPGKVNGIPHPIPVNIEVNFKLR
jgi:TonB family protein